MNGASPDTPSRPTTAVWMPQPSANRSRLASWASAGKCTSGIGPSCSISTRPASTSTARRCGRSAASSSGSSVSRK
ncbi:MAG: hypothetical protein KL785_03815 [Brevundimonas sp.]|nr:hypothetical protein [Brevundimonas sp.]